MVNGLAVLGWGVGGIEAEAAMLGQPIPMLIPEVIGFRMTGVLPEGATATDLVLTVTQILRKKGVVGKFVEYFGPGLEHLTVEDQATLANMAPEYGATCGFFPVTRSTINYLAATGRAPDRVALVEAYAKQQGLWVEPGMEEPVFTETLELDLSTVLPSLAGPKRPQDRVLLVGLRRQLSRGAPGRVRQAWRGGRGARRGPRSRPRCRQRRRGDRRDHLLHQHLEPKRTHRRRPAGEERRGQGPEVQAVGEDVAGARLAGGHRLSRTRRG